MRFVFLHHLEFESNDVSSAETSNLCVSSSYSPFLSPLPVLSASSDKRLYMGEIQ